MTKNHWRSRWIALGSLALCSVLLVACSSGGSQQPSHIYWANTGIHKGDALKATAHTIGRANIDGTQATQSTVSGLQFPNGVAVHGNYIYWTDTDANAIGRSKLDGSDSNPRFINTGVKLPDGVAVSDTYIYWTNNGTNTIGRARVDGSQVNANFISQIKVPDGITVDGKYIYWTNWRNGIARAQLDGTHVNEDFIDNAGIQSKKYLSPIPIGIAVDSQYVYWPDMVDNTIARAKIDGSGKNLKFITGVDFVGGVAVDSSYIYWANNSDTIGRAKLDGTGVDQKFITGAHAPAGLAVW